MKTLLCVGDSHARLIGQKPDGGDFRYARVSVTAVNGFDTANVISIKGATAAGFYPKNDRKSSYSRAARAIKRLDPAAICFGFGQVDAELSCYFVAFRDNIRLADAITAKLEAQKRYLEACKEVAGNRAIVIKGLNTATIQDPKDLRKMLHRRIRTRLQAPRGQFTRRADELGITIQRHWDINAELSSGLKEKSRALGLPYFDLRDVTGSEDNPGLSKPEYCVGGGDVHLRQSALVEDMFSRALAKAVQSTKTVPTP
ncbi:hypothetical protein [Ruegeria meonggei]|uniref:SGNH hydrolase-type esterase domain-containing protein n=1 Tax=Ruegeria meonggei TaxID=1446476 RepID=A0A1X7A9J0_9RHOB|nr:hypothetical protein [Ruegeria meonggei]SLN73852.1 hypothetical protein RUM8411_03927 [Ruegeria meonggei]